MINGDRSAYAALLLRLALGLMFLSHGLMKVFAFGFAGTAGFFESLGLPAALAYATIAAEILGGLCLVLGVYARIVAVVLLPVLAGAWIFVHAGNGWMFANPGGGWEYIAFLMIASVAVALLDDSRFALKPTHV